MGGGREEGREEGRGGGGEGEGGVGSGLEWEGSGMEWDRVGWSERGGRRHCCPKVVGTHRFCWSGRLLGNRGRRELGRWGCMKEEKKAIKTQVYHKPTSHDPCSRRHGQRTGQWFSAGHGTLQTTLVPHTTAA